MSNARYTAAYISSSFVIDRLMALREVHAYKIVLTFQTPGHHVVLFEETSGDRHATIVMKCVPLAASTTLVPVMQSFFSLTIKPTLAFVVDAMQSYGPFPD
jgi:hypothetical protein